jgi:hypothetical protein
MPLVSLTLLRFAVEAGLHATQRAVAADRAADLATSTTRRNTFKHHAHACQT